MSKQWTLMEVLRWTAEHFGSKGIQSPRLDAELIVAYALGLRRIDLYMKPELPLNDGEREAVRELVKRRLDGEPVAYLTGMKEFWTMPFRVTKDVLIPRPETEDVVEQAHLNLLNRVKDPLRFLDIGTGCGCIAAAIAKEFPNAGGVATDNSPAALEIARQNLESLGFSDRLTLRQGDVYKALEKGDGPFDLIISNPPYIPSNLIETLSPEVKSEPLSALDGGRDGLDIVKKILEGASSVMNKGGFLVIEIHESHGDAVGSLAAKGLSFKGAGKDLAGLMRMAWWSRD